MPKVFIGSIKKDSESASLKTTLLEFGFIKEAEILHPSDGVISKGFAIVNCELENISYKAFLKTKIHLEGALLYLAPYLEGDEIKKRNEELAKKKVFISGIPDDFSNSQLIKLFSCYGGIETAYINKKRKIKRKREEKEGSDCCPKVFFGFVTFYEEESAQKCLESGVKHLGYDFEVNCFTPKPLTDFKEKEDTSNKKKKKSQKIKKIIKKKTLPPKNQKQRSFELYLNKKNEYRQETAVMRTHPLMETKDIEHNHNRDNLRINRALYPNCFTRKFSNNYYWSNSSRNNSCFTENNNSRNLLISNLELKTLKSPLQHNQGFWGEDAGRGKGKGKNFFYERFTQKKREEEAFAAKYNYSVF